MGTVYIISLIPCVRAGVNEVAHVFCGGLRAGFGRGLAVRAPVREQGIRYLVHCTLHAGTFPFLAKFIVEAGSLAAVGG